MYRLLYLAFALSGGAGLIYEVVWGRYLALFVGHSAYAQVLVIGTYLGGMAVGALLVGEAVRKIRSPLLWYAAAEAGLSVAGLAFHRLFLLVTALAYDRVIPSLESPLLGSGFKWGLAVGILLPQAVLLGTTFPLMASGVIRTFRDLPGRTLSFLYFANSLGGAAGVLVGGFLLVGALGMPGSLATAAILNLLAAGMALLVHARTGPGREEGRERPGEDGPGRAGRWAPGYLAPDLRRLLMAVSFLTAMASFAYEIGWIRMLSLVMGSATHSFEVMLSAFILGLALGALFIRGKADLGPRSLPVLGWVQWGMGMAALATLPLYASTFEVMAFLVDTLPNTEGGYALFGLARYAIAVAIMLPATILAGMTLPLITAALLHGGAGERSIGWVYGFNTLGSVAGVALAGLVLLPALGLKGLIVAGAMLDAGLGILLLLRAPASGVPGRLRMAGWGAAVTGILAGTLAVGGVKLDQRLLVGGVFRYGAIPDPSEPVLFYADGRTATVGVHLGEPGDLAILTTNGKPDASISLRWIRAQSELLTPRPIRFDDEATQTLLGLLPLAHRPGARSAALIGHGSGLTGQTILASPAVERAVTIEIEPEVIRASQVFYPANAAVFDDVRSTFVLDDAKAYFAGSHERFDVIVSEPSNPWVSGTSSLFTAEFYLRVRRFLAPGGVFAQWMHCYEMTDTLVASVLAGLHQAFPHYRGYEIGPCDLVVVASMDEAVGDPDWAVLRYPAVERMLAHVPPLTPTQLGALLVFDEEAIGPYLGRFRPVNSDFAPYLDLGAEKARFMRSGAEGFAALGRGRIPLTAFSGEAPRGFADGWEQPILGLAPLEALSVGAWLRWARFRDVPLAEAPSPLHRAALEGYRTLSLRLNLGVPPEDWRAFMGLATGVEGNLHGGTAGVADSVFFGRLFQFLREQEAPEPARAVGDFLLGVAAWDHPRTLGAGEILLRARERGEAWLPEEVLLEGCVLAHLGLDDPEGAREVMDRLGEGGGGSGEAQGLRTRILQALIDDRMGVEQPPPA